MLRHTFCSLGSRRVVYVVMDKTTEAKIFSASVDENTPLKPFLAEADSQKHGALNQVWKTVKVLLQDH